MLNHFPLIFHEPCSIRIVKSPRLDFREANFLGLEANHITLLSIVNI